MGHIITIPCVVEKKQNHTILDPERDFGYLIEQYMGDEARRLYEEIIADYKSEVEAVLGDDYESIADGYRNELVSTMNALKEELDKPRLNRKNVERIYDNLYKNL